MRIRVSKVFTNAELKALNKRTKGNKADPTGIYSARVKPKIKELLGMFNKIEFWRKFIKK